MEEEKMYCSDCGDEITEENGYYTTRDGDIICESCYENGYITCSDCGEIIPSDEATHIEDVGRYVCDSCLDNYNKCEDCGDYFYGDLTYVEDFGYVCDSCYSCGDYGCCEDCGSVYCGDDLNYHEGNDCYYCNDCFEEHENPRGLIYGYHDFNDWKLFNGKNEENPPYYIGKEIELEATNGNENLHEVIDTMNKYLNAVGMRDGSLGYGGVEIVTHPESWKYLQENKEKYKQFFKKMEEIHYGDNGNTGLHFHVTRPNDDVISRLIVILESFKDEIKKLSRRNGDFHWSRFITDNNRDEMENLKYKSTKYIKEKYIHDRNESGDRYVALNLTNTKTIEFRFFNGANNFEEFWGALQFIHNLMEVATKENRDINTITWKELIKGKELEAQANRQNVLNINKCVKDTTSILEKLEEAQENTKKEIKKTLKNFIKYLSKEMEEKRLEIVNRNDIDIIEENINSFMNTLSNDLRYLQRVRSVYRDVDYNSIKYTKDLMDNIKNNYTRNLNGYSRYFKQVEDTIKKYESEVLE